MKTIRILTVIIIAGLGAVALPAMAGSDCSSKQAEAQAATSPSIVEIAQSGGFDTLVTALKAAGLVDALNAEGPMTVFAPTDAAFAKLPEGTVDALLKDPKALKQILLYHVVSGKVEAKDVVKLKSAKTLEGQTVSIDTSKGVMVNNANVVKADIEASNGVIHVIDTVLIPTSM